MIPFFFLSTFSNFRIFMEYDVAKFYYKVPSPVVIHRSDISEILHQDLHAFLGTSPSSQAKTQQSWLGLHCIKYNDYVLIFIYLLLENPILILCSSLLLSTLHFLYILVTGLHFYCIDYKSVANWKKYCILLEKLKVIALFGVLLQVIES
jgi:hypothetical protein